MKKAIIIGGGVGGLSTAVRLLVNGFEVHIYEKESSLGGKVNLLLHNNFRFDLTASLLMTPEIYKDVFTYANRDYKNYINILKVDPFYRVFFEDKSQYDFSTDLTELIKTIDSISPKDTSNYIKFLNDSYEKYTIANKYFLNTSFLNFKDFFNFSTVCKTLKLNPLSSTYNYISKFIKNEKLKNFLCFQSMYVGISPFNGSNIYTIVPTMSQFYGLWQIKGGMYSYIEALEKLILELGGKIHKNTEVTEILFSNKKAIGIKTYKNIDKASVIVCNADFPYAIDNLVKDNYLNENFSNLKYSCSTFIMYLALKKKYPCLSTHNLYLSNNFKCNLEAPFVGKLSLNPSLYLYCPSRLDNTVCPTHNELVNITVRVPNLLSKDIIWNQNTIQHLRNQVINKIKSIKGLDDIDKNIEYESYLTPVDLKTKFNAYNGAAFGISHTLSQTTYFRPQIKCNEIDNLYFVGSSIHPGTGVSMVLLCSKMASEEIINNLKYQL